MKENSVYKEELNFCLQLWESQGYCEFGGHTKCEQCAAPYILLKLATGEVLHGKMKRLTLEGWKDKIRNI